MDPIHTGMWFTVSKDEIKQHFEARKQYHEERCQEYIRKVKEFNDELEASLGKADTVTDRLAVKSSSVFNNVQSQRDNAHAMASNHAKKAVIFAWYLNHLPMAPIFNLDKNELQHLEFIGMV